MKAYWLYGRSGAGKTTLARSLLRTLRAWGEPVILLDGDDIRHGLGRDLGFDSVARIENHRRIAEVARLVLDQGIQPVVATMAPEYAQRDSVTAVLGSDLAWILVHAPLEVCLARDPKGLYRRERQGELKGLLEYPFDPPRPGEADRVVDTGRLDLAAAECELLRLVALGSVSAR